MSILTKTLVSVTVALPAVAFAQSSTEATYCSALAQKYQQYVGQNDAKRRAQNPDATMSNAIAECGTGKAAHAIPVLEKALKDAKIDLPPRT